MGGDEFAILQVGISQPPNATRCGRIIECERSTDRRPSSADRHLRGHAVGPADGRSPEQLIPTPTSRSIAPSATARRLSLLRAEMDAQMQARRAMEYDCACAAAGQSNCTTSRCQPGDRQDQRLRALVRWRHPIKGLIRRALHPLAGRSA